MSGRLRTRCWREGMGALRLDILAEASAPKALAAQLFQRPFFLCVAHQILKNSHLVLACLISELLVGLHASFLETFYDNVKCVYRCSRKNLQAREACAQAQDANLTCCEL